MSSENNKMPVNLYGIVDNELARMHALMQTYLTLPSNQTSSYGQHGVGSLSSMSSFGAGAHNQVPMLYKRILEMQNLILAAVTSHDAVIQDKVAELALTGVRDETKM